MALKFMRSFATVMMVTTAATAFGADEVSVERGGLVAIIGGCHDCHTEGYMESEGAIDPEKALKGRRVGGKVLGERRMRRTFAYV